MTKRLLGAILGLLLPALAARAVDLPEFREGLWEAHTRTIDKASNRTDDNTFKICRSNATERKAYDAIKAMKQCSYEIQNLGDCPAGTKPGQIIKAGGT